MTTAIAHTDKQVADGAEAILKSAVDRTAKAEALRVLPGSVLRSLYREYPDEIRKVYQTSDQEAIKKAVEGHVAPILARSLRKSEALLETPGSAEDTAPAGASVSTAAGAESTPPSTIPTAPASSRGGQIASEAQQSAPPSPARSNSRNARKKLQPSLIQPSPEELYERETVTMVAVFKGSLQTKGTKDITREVCLKMDRLRRHLPRNPKWGRDSTTWMDAYLKHRVAVKTWISRTRLSLPE